MQNNIESILGSEDRCVICGKYTIEGSWVCQECQKQSRENNLKINYFERIKRNTGKEHAENKLQSFSEDDRGKTFKP